MNTTFAFKPLRPMRKQDLFWLAGFMEGEGSFGAGRSGRSMRASQVNPEPIARIVTFCGGTVSRFQYGHKPILSWGLSGHAARELAHKLYPLMSQKRQRQMETMLPPLIPRGQHQRIKTACAKGHIYDESNTALRPKLSRAGKPYIARSCRTCERDLANSARLRKAVID